MNDSTQQKLLQAFPTLSKTWDESVIPKLMEYIRIPNKSPVFDANWEAHGYMQQAAQLLMDWCRQQPIQDMHIELLQLNQRTPLLFIDIPGNNNDESIILYGHLDKQPEMRGWDKGLSPWEPVIKDGKLYGRGGADDGYSTFAALTAIAQLQQLNIPHARCVILIEASEESGSTDLPFYLEALYPRIKNPTFVIGLDSGCGNYQQLWGTTSLRGMISGVLNIQVLRQGIHSGYGGGAVPSAFSILRLLLDRVEDARTSIIKLPELHTPVPTQQCQHAKILADTLGDKFLQSFPFFDKTQPTTTEMSELLLRRSWHPALAIIGIEGLPAIADSGNVIIPELSVKVSLRIPPNCEPVQALQALQQTLERDPPHQATITFTPADITAGWLATPLATWLATANEQSSQLFFNKPAMYIGEGGTIPFMGMLATKFPEAQFLITGVLGPGSNAHGPNEFLHIDMAKRLTACVANIIAAHYAREKSE